jgi:fucose 4-O-acetylase-like acetyltransferase
MCGGSENLDVLSGQLDKILKEYLLSDDHIEVLERLRTLHVPHYYHQLVYLVGYYALENYNENTMEKLAWLLKVSS